MKKVHAATPVEIPAEDRAALESWSRSFKVEHRLRQRALIVLKCGEGKASRLVAREVGCTPGTASHWRVRYAREGLAGLEDRPRKGANPVYTDETNRRILATLNETPPPGYARWSAPLLRDALGDVSDQHIWRFLRAQKIDLARRKSWCVSKDPEFAVKAADIIGLYLNPPENAIVLAVDEKPSIQALERAQGYLKLANGKTLTGHSHNYKRHGTTTLFAALEIATGKVTGTHAKRRRRRSFWPS
jgi:transposase